MKAGVVSSVFLALVLVWPGPVRAASPRGQVAQDVSDIVWCYDEDRDLVTRKPAWKCADRIIDEAQARKIRLQRTRRIQGLIKEPEPFFPGQRLSGTGSGFFVTETGSVLTNWHVVDRCKGISFTPASGKPLVAELVASEKLKDLALLRTSFTPAGVAPFRSSLQPDRSEDVFVVGYPLHGKVAIKPILVAGHVVDAGSSQRPGRFPMQIDVRRGNSGGPVLDRAGRVVGIVVAKVNTLSVYAETGRLIRDVGIAIRLPVALDFLKQHDITIRERSAAPPLSITEIYSKAHQFVGQVGCWR
ncbi:MAG: serine protease [Proteobacteria bacterium]|nr:serine protease [Pseudomonadota bacterium]